MVTLRAPCWRGCSWWANSPGAGRDCERLPPEDEFGREPAPSYCCKALTMASHTRRPSGPSVGGSREIEKGTLHLADHAGHQLCTPLLPHVLVPAPATQPSRQRSVRGFRRNSKRALGLALEGGLREAEVGLGLSARRCGAKLRVGLHLWSGGSITAGRGRVRWTPLDRSSHTSPVRCPK